jgi:hypothetical protein
MGDVPCPEISTFKVWATMVTTPLLLGMLPLGALDEVLPATPAEEVVEFAGVALLEVVPSPFVLVGWLMLATGVELPATDAVPPPHDDSVTKPHNKTSSV